MINCLKNRKGFTLLEMMAVIGIIGILIGIVAPNFKAYITKGHDTLAIVDARNFHSAVAAEVLVGNTTELVGGIESLILFNGSNPPDGFIGHPKVIISGGPLEYNTSSIYAPFYIKGELDIYHEESNSYVTLDGPTGAISPLQPAS